jgi:hypothetical protein
MEWMSGMGRRKWVFARRGLGRCEELDGAVRSRGCGLLGYKSWRFSKIFISVFLLICFLQKNKRPRKKI